VTVGAAEAAVGRGWQVTGTSLDAGWLLIPEHETEADAGAWVRENTDALRIAWADAWQPVFHDVVPAMLRAAVEHRRAEDALAFQLWPTNAPVCIFVHVQAGILEPAALPGPGEGVLYEAAGLGQGVQSVIVETVGGARVIGVRFVFASPELTVVVEVEPTLPELLATLFASVHGFVQSLRVTASDGTAFVAAQPRLLEAGPGDSWVDSMTTS